MRAWIFRMEWRVVDRVPDRVTLRIGIVVDVAIPNGRDRAPEIVVIFGVEHCDEGIVSGQCDLRHEPGAVEKIELPGSGYLAHYRIVDDRPRSQPEAGVLGLPRGALAAGSSTERLDFVVVGGPLLAVERNRRLRAELRGARQGERLQ